MLDLDRIAMQAHARQARLVLDLSQSLGVLPVRLDAWKPEFVIAVGYKWLLGGYGLAWLWAAPQWRENGKALEQGWMAYDQDAFWQPGNTAIVGPLPGARRYDAGGVCDAMRLSMAEAGLAQVQAWGIPAITAQLRLRTDALARALEQRGLGALRRPGHAPHICGLRPPAERFDAVATALQRAGIIVTVGPECLRVAPHLHVGVDEMARVAETVAAAL
jgi:selenocysteine lyase/cysteine desulfurase